MAKKQVFGEDAKSLKDSHRKMARVIISSKNDRGKYAFRERMVDQADVNNFIQNNK